MQIPTGRECELDTNMMQCKHKLDNMMRQHTKLHYCCHSFKFTLPLIHIIGRGPRPGPPSIHEQMRPMYCI